MKFTKSSRKRHITKGMKMRYIALCLIIGGIATLAFADGKSQQPPKERTRPVWKWDEAVGKKVAVEGLAWGYMNKGLSCWVVTGEGGRLYVSGVEFGDLNGKLVRLVGVLRKKHMNAAPPGAQGYGEGFDYFEIEVSRHEVIESTEAAWVSLRGESK